MKKIYMGQKFRLRNMDEAGSTSLKKLSKMN